MLFLAPCSIVRSFEEIVSVFARQLEVGNRTSFMTENILFVAELVSWVACNMENRSPCHGLIFILQHAANEYCLCVHVLCVNPCVEGYDDLASSQAPPSFSSPALW